MKGAYGRLWVPSMAQSKHIPSEWMGKKKEHSLLPRRDDGT